MENIKHLLRQIEESKKVKILFACETGSRAWGFPSPDSDFDIRFIYMHERDWYLSLSKKDDTIEFMDGDLDITGWDLKKSLTLLKKSNAPLVERFQSPIEYYSVPGFRDEFKTLIGEYYSPTAVFFHHHSLAYKFWSDLKGKGLVKLKSYFYLLRSLLSCNWIMNNKAVLPMHMDALMQYIDNDLRVQLNQLIEIKAGKDESYLHLADASINEWIDGMFSRMDIVKNDLGVNRNGMTMLNEFFLKQLYEKAND